MGICDLLPFLRKNAPNAFSPLLEWKVNRNCVRVAVDVPIFMYKNCYSVGNGVPLCDKMLKFAQNLKEDNFYPIFVFDGEPLIAKNEEREKRFVKCVRAMELKILKSQFAVFCDTDFAVDEEYEVERTVLPSGKPTKEDFEALKEACKLSGIEIKIAKYEAEALCAHLCFIGEVDAVLTEDSDTAAYLCNAIILNWKHSTRETVLNAQKAVEELKLTTSEFHDLCILFGNDFNERIKGIGPVKSYSYIKKHGCIENVLKLHPQINAEKMFDTRKIFQTYCFENENYRTAE